VHHMKKWVEEKKWVKNKWLGKWVEEKKWVKNKWLGKWVKKWVEELGEEMKWRSGGTKGGQQQATWLLWTWGCLVKSNDAFFLLKRRIASASSSSASSSYSLL
jgi:hypothetical protein